MTNPITPPPDLVQQWASTQKYDIAPAWVLNEIATRAARRPKPPSLKEQALAELAEWENVMDIAPDSPIRRALEALPDEVSEV